jgi:hypothetical protein
MNASERELILYIYDRLALVHLEPLSLHYMQDLKKIIDASDDQAAMLTAFRHAANSIGVEAGITKDHVGHGEIAESVCGDVFYLELISEAEERFKRLSAKYEKLRAASTRTVDEYGKMPVDLFKMGPIRGLKEALSND